MKRFLPLLFLASIANAGDLTTSPLIQDGVSLHAADFNNLINNAVISPAFISGKSVATPISVDSIAFYQLSSNAVKQTPFSSISALILASPTFTGTLTSSQATVISGILSPTAITADQNNYNPATLSTATTLRLSSDATRNITGLSGGGDGRILLIHNVGSFSIVLNDENASSSAANRFALYHDQTIPPDGIVFLQYDNTSSRWRSTTSHTHSLADVTDAGANLNPPFTALTDGATVTLTATPNNVVQSRTWTLGATGTYPHILQFSGVTTGMSGYLIVTQDGTGSRKICLPGPQFPDATTATNTTVTSATAAFVASDVGGQIVGAGIPVGATITVIGSGTSVTISAATTATASGVTITLPNRYSKVVSGGRGAVTLSATANATDVLTWVCTGANSYLWAGGTNFN